MATALVVLLTCAFTAAPAGAAARGCAGATAAITPATLPGAYGAVLCLVNRERALRRARPLRSSPLLVRAALAHSTEMVAESYFAHAGLDGSTPVRRVLRTGYFRGRTSGPVEETLACGWAELSSPEALVASLMRSASHRGILLDRRLRDIGIGLVLGGPDARGDGGATLTLDLARR